MARKKSNFLGIMKYEESTFATQESASGALKTSDFIDRKNPSGDKISLFWGLINLQDY